LDGRYRPEVGARRYAVVGGPAAPAEPAERKEEFVEIRTPDERLVTLLDVVSPSNQTTREGREAYLATRALAKAAPEDRGALIVLTSPPYALDRTSLPEFSLRRSMTRAITNPTMPS
jgi:hypothetical protein